MSDIAPFRLPDGEAPESDVDDLGSLYNEVRQPLQLLRRRSPRASSLTHLTLSRCAHDCMLTQDGYERKKGLQPTYKNMRHDPSDDRNDEAYGISSFIAQNKSIISGHPCCPLCEDIKRPL